MQTVRNSLTSLSRHLPCYINIFSACSVHRCFHTFQATISRHQKNKMYSPAQLPIRHTSETEPGIKRHHTARYYAHRVRESLVSRVSKQLCAIFLLLLLTAGIIVFIVWLSLRPHRPRFHIRGFSIPGLDQPNGFENAEITFNVTARNSNQHIGIHYDSMEGLVYYKDQKVGATPLADSFYQEPKNTTILYGILSGATLTLNSQRWMEFTYDRGQGKIAFRLEIKSAIRFKVSSWWDSKRHTLHANCEVAVGSNGMILPIYKEKRCSLYFT